MAVSCNIFTSIVANDFVPEVTVLFFSVCVCVCVLIGVEGSLFSLSVALVVTLRREDDEHRVPYLLC